MRHEAKQVQAATGRKPSRPAATLLAWLVLALGHQLITSPSTARTLTRAKRVVRDVAKLAVPIELDLPAECLELLEQAALDEGDGREVDAGAALRRDGKATKGERTRRPGR